MRMMAYAACVVVVERVGVVVVVVVEVVEVEVEVVEEVGLGLVVLVVRLLLTGGFHTLRCNTPCLRHSLLRCSPGNCQTRCNIRQYRTGDLPHHHTRLPHIHNLGILAHHSRPHYQNVVRVAVVRVVVRRSAPRVAATVWVERVVVVVVVVAVAEQRCLQGHC